MTLLPTLKTLLLAAACLPAVPAFSGIVDSDYFCKDIKRPFFRAETGRDGTSRVVPGRPRAVPFEFLSSKPAGTARIFIIGESAASLLGRGEDRLLEFLGAAVPGKTPELINCGMPTYESRRIAGVFEEALSYQPDLLILLSGNNETGREFCPDFRSDLDRRARKIKTRLAELSLSQEEAPAAVSLAMHEGRLRDLASLAKKKGVPVMFCTLPANLRDFSPSGYLPEGLADDIRLAVKDPAAALVRFARRGGQREPFSLFYSGRALEALGRPRDARKKYAEAVKRDPAMDRCSDERNAMIRRVAKEEGSCLADLEETFSAAAKNGITGGTELADGVHWFKKYSPFVNAALARAAAGCLGANPGKIPEPGGLLPAGPAREDFPLLLSYAGAYALDQATNPERPNAVPERLVTALERLYRLDRARLERLLADEDALGTEVLASPWNTSLKKDLATWRPTLLRGTAEMLRRAGKEKEAAKAEAGLAAAEKNPDRPGAAESAPPKRPFRAGEPQGKRLTDKAVTKILKGELAAARELLKRAAEADPDSLETRLTACSLAARLRDAAFGEAQCGEAIYLASFPPYHARPVPDGQAAAFFSRAVMRLETGGRESCADLTQALKKASAAWPQAAEAKTLAARCSKKK
jgi:tetratricopeptide (TPR) repeat protein